MYKFLTVVFITSLSALFSMQQAQAEACKLDNLKVQRRGPVEGSSNFYYSVGNLEYSIYLSDADKVLKPLLEKSLKDPSFSFSLETSGMNCDQLESSKSYKSTPFLTEITVARESLGETVDCIDCAIGKAPTLFEFPSMAEIGDILDRSTGLDPERVEAFQKRLYNNLKNLNYQTPQANTILIIALMLESLAELEVKKLNSDQLQYLVAKFSDKLTVDMRNYVEKIVGQIKGVEFTVDKNTVIKLATTSSAIIIGPKDIPAKNDWERAMIDENFDSAKIANGASLTFLKDSGNKRKVKISGFEGKGVVPMIGKVGIKPVALKLDALSNAPVVASIEVKKLVWFTKDFEINF